MRFKLSINLDHPSFAMEQPARRDGTELGSILIKLGKNCLGQYVDDRDYGDLLDSKGNTVGRWEVEGVE